MKKNKNISIIIPCYNEEDAIKQTFERISDVIGQFNFKDIFFDFIFVDDGSIDNTVKIIQAFPKENVKLVRLSRNFGHQAAVKAGIDSCISDAAIIIDADLQDPPELIKQMIEKYKDGYDVVYAIRQSRQGESLFKKVSAYYFYRILNLLSDFTIPQDVGDYRLIGKRIIKQLQDSSEHEPYLRGMIAWVGFRQIGIPYIRDKRIAGDTKYPLKKMLALAFSGITSFSVKPLKIVIFLGFLTMLAAIMTLFYILYVRLFTSAWVLGWTAVMFAILFIGSIQLLAIGIIGEYISKIHFQVKKRPNYIKFDD